MEGSEAEGSAPGAPPSPLSGGYLLIVLGEPYSALHKGQILQKIQNGFLSWDKEACHVDLEKELQLIASQAPDGEESKNGERLIQFASENLVTEVLIHPTLNTLTQCIRNLLSSFTRHRHIIHAGYTFTGNGSWIIQDGTFSLADLIDAFQEPDVLRVLRAYENTVSVDIHCAPEGDWSTARMRRELFSKLCCVRVNPDDSLTPATNIDAFMNYISKYLQETSLEQLLEPSDVVGNIRFSHPTLYVFPGGQGDAALFGINGFNMLVDGGFSRKACFWDFTRHLDRLDAVLMTRLNNSNCNGMAAVLRRKRQAHVYPQIGHFFCNIQERRQPQSPEGEKERDSLLINLAEEGQEMVYNLRHLHLKSHFCSRDSTVEPINLYHKVGHGKLDMYVLSPAKDSRDLKEFLSKWHANDQSLFGSSMKKKGEFHFPLNNLVSICSLLVWQPANPNETITRLLFPGSAPQHKIFEGLEKLKNLDFLKHPVCSAKTLSPSSSTLGMTIRSASKSRPVPAVIDKLLPGEGLNKPVSKTISSVESVNKQNIAKSATIPVAAPITSDIKPKTSSAQKPAIQKQPRSEKPIDESILTKTEVDMDKDKNKLDKDKIYKDKIDKDKDKLDTDKDIGKEKESETETKETEGKMIPSKIEKPPRALIDSKTKTEQKIKSSKSKGETKPTSKNVERKPSKTPSIEKKGDSVKSSPTTPKKTIESKVQKTTSTRAPSKSRASPSATPAKSAKEENNRKVVESKRTTSLASRSALSKPPKKEIQKTEKKVTKRPTASPSKAPLKSESPKKPISKVSKTKTKKEPKKEKPEMEKGVATDSSTVSTPSTADAEITATKLKETDKEKESILTDEVSVKERKVELNEQENIDEAEKLSDRLEDEGIEKDVELTDRGDISDDGIKITLKDDLTTEKSFEAEETGEEKFTKETAEDVKEDDSLIIHIQEKDESERDEEDEILIIEKVEIEPYIEDSTQDQESIDSHEVEEIEDELQKHLRDETESEKKSKKDFDKSDQDSVKKEDETEKIMDSVGEGVSEVKVDGEAKLAAKVEQINLDLKDQSVSDLLSPENKEQIEGEVQEIISSATDFITKVKLDGKDTSEISAEGVISDDLRSSGDAKDLQDIQFSDDKNVVQKYDQLKDDDLNKLKDLADTKYGAEESQPDEKLSTTIESGATTAPTLPEDERIQLDEIKEGIEEKHVKEETKEKDVGGGVSKVEQPTSLPQIAVGSGKSFEGRMQVTRDIVKTPDEVADLPVHEEVDAELYESEELSGRDFHRSKDDLLGVNASKKILVDAKEQKSSLEKDAEEKEDAQEKKIAQENEITEKKKTEKEVVKTVEEPPRSVKKTTDTVPGEEVQFQDDKIEGKPLKQKENDFVRDEIGTDIEESKFYHESGLVEQPIHTTVRAPEVAEYVMLTPDSTPDSPIPKEEVRILDKEIAQSSKDEKDVDTKQLSDEEVVCDLPEEEKQTPSQKVLEQKDDAEDYKKQVKKEFIEEILQDEFHEKHPKQISGSTEVTQLAVKPSPKEVEDDSLKFSKKTDLQVDQKLKDELFKKEIERGDEEINLVDKKLGKEPEGASKTDIEDTSLEKLHIKSEPDLEKEAKPEEMILKEIKGEVFSKKLGKEESISKGEIAEKILDSVPLEEARKDDKEILGLSKELMKEEEGVKIPKEKLDSKHAEIIEDVLIEKEFETAIAKDESGTILKTVEVTSMVKDIAEEKFGDADKELKEKGIVKESFNQDIRGAEETTKPATSEEKLKHISEKEVSKQIDKGIAGSDHAKETHEITAETHEDIKSDPSVVVGTKQKLEDEEKVEKIEDILPEKDEIKMKSETQIDTVEKESPLTKEIDTKKLDQVEKMQSDELIQISHDIKKESEEIDESLLDNVKEEIETHEKETYLEEGKSVLKEDIQIEVIEKGETEPFEKENIRLDEEAPVQENVKVKELICKDEKSQQDFDKKEIGHDKTGVTTGAVKELEKQVLISEDETGDKKSEEFKEMIYSDGKPTVEDKLDNKGELIKSELGLEVKGGVEKKLEGGKPEITKDSEKLEDFKQITQIDKTVEIMKSEKETEKIEKVPDENAIKKKEEEEIQPAKELKNVQLESEGKGKVDKIAEESVQLVRDSEKPVLEIKCDDKMQREKFEKEEDESDVIEKNEEKLDAKDDVQEIKQTVSEEEISDEKFEKEVMESNKEASETIDASMKSVKEAPTVAAPSVVKELQTELGSIKDEKQTVNEESKLKSEFGAKKMEDDLSNVIKDVPSEKFKTGADDGLIKTDLMVKDEDDKKLTEDNIKIDSLQETKTSEDIFKKIKEDEITSVHEEKSKPGAEKFLDLSQSKSSLLQDSEDREDKKFEDEASKEFNVSKQDDKMKDDNLDVALKKSPISDLKESSQSEGEILIKGIKIGEKPVSETLEKTIQKKYKTEDMKKQGIQEMKYDIEDTSFGDHLIAEEDKLVETVHSATASPQKLSSPLPLEKDTIGNVKMISAEEETHKVESVSGKSIPQISSEKEAMIFDEKLPEITEKTSDKISSHSLSVTPKSISPVPSGEEMTSVSTNLCASPESFTKEKDSKPGLSDSKSITPKSPSPVLGGNLSYDQEKESSSIIDTHSQEIMDSCKPLSTSVSPEPVQKDATMLPDKIPSSRSDILEKDEESESGIPDTKTSPQKIDTDSPKIHASTLETMDLSKHSPSSVSPEPAQKDASILPDKISFQSSDVVPKEEENETDIPQNISTDSSKIYTITQEPIDSSKPTPSSVSPEPAQKDTSILLGKISFTSSDALPKGEESKTDTSDSKIGPEKIDTDISKICTSTQETMDLSKTSPISVSPEPAQKDTSVLPDKTSFLSSDAVPKEEESKADFSDSKSSPEKIDTDSSKIYASPQEPMDSSKPSPSSAFPEPAEKDTSILPDKISLPSSDAVLKGEESKTDTTDSKIGPEKIDTDISKICTRTQEPVDSSKPSPSSISPEPTQKDTSILPDKICSVSPEPAQKDMSVLPDKTSFLSSDAVLKEEKSKIDISDSKSSPEKSGTDSSKMYAQETMDLSKPSPSSVLPEPAQEYTSILPDKISSPSSDAVSKEDESKTDTPDSKSSLNKDISPTVLKSDVDSESIVKSEPEKEVETKTCTNILKDASLSVSKKETEMHSKDLTTTLKEEDSKDKISDSKEVTAESLSPIETRESETGIKSVSKDSNILEDQKSQESDSGIKLAETIHGNEKFDKNIIHPESELSLTLDKTNLPKDDNLSDAMSLYKEKSDSLKIDSKGSSLSEKPEILEAAEAVTLEAGIIHDLTLSPKSQSPTSEKDGSIDKKLPILAPEEKKKDEKSLASTSLLLESQTEVHSSEKETKLTEEIKGTRGVSAKELDKFEASIFPTKPDSVDSLESSITVERVKLFEQKLASKEEASTMVGMGITDSDLTKSVCPKSSELPSEIQGEKKASIPELVSSKVLKEEKDMSDKIYIEEVIGKEVKHEDKKATAEGLKTSADSLDSIKSFSPSEEALAEKDHSSVKKSFVSKKEGLITVDKEHILEESEPTFQKAIIDHDEELSLAVKEVEEHIKAEIGQSEIAATSKSSELSKVEEFSISSSESSNKDVDQGETTSFSPEQFDKTELAKSEDHPEQLLSDISNLPISNEKNISSVPDPKVSEKGPIQELDILKDNRKIETVPTINGTTARSSLVSDKLISDQDEISPKKLKDVGAAEKSGEVKREDIKTDPHVFAEELHPSDEIKSFGTSSKEDIQLKVQESDKKEIPEFYAISEKDEKSLLLKSSPSSFESSDVKVFSNIVPSKETKDLQTIETSGSKETKEKQTDERAITNGESKLPNLLLSGIKTEVSSVPSESKQSIPATSLQSCESSVSYSEKTIESKHQTDEYLSRKAEQNTSTKVDEVTSETDSLMLKSVTSGGKEKFEIQYDVETYHIEGKESRLHFDGRGVDLSSLSSKIVKGTPEIFSTSCDSSLPSDKTVDSKSETHTSKTASPLPSDNKEVDTIISQSETVSSKSSSPVPIDKDINNLQGTIVDSRIEVGITTSTKSKTEDTKTNGETSHIVLSENYEKKIEDSSSSSSSSTKTIATDQITQEKTDLKVTSSVVPVSETGTESEDLGTSKSKTVVKEESGAVHRMVVTASSEDGGSETELCASGSIKFASQAEHKDKSPKGSIDTPVETNIVNGESTSYELKDHDLDEKEKSMLNGTYTDDEGTSITTTTTTTTVKTHKDGSVTKITSVTHSDGDKTDYIEKTSKSGEIVQHVEKTLKSDDVASKESDVSLVKGVVETASHAVKSLTGDVSGSDTPVLGVISELKKDALEMTRSGTPGSDMSEREFDIGGPSTPHSEISSGQVSRAATNIWGENSEGRRDSQHYDSDDDVPCSPLSVTSHMAISPPQFDFEVQQGEHDLYLEDAKLKDNQKIPSSMTSSFYGSLPGDNNLDQGSQLLRSEEDAMYSSMYIPHGFVTDEPEKVSEGQQKMGQFEAMFSGVSKEDVDFETARKEHFKTRGEDLTSTDTFTNGNKEGIQINGRQATNGTSKSATDIVADEKLKGKSVLIESQVSTSKSKDESTEVKKSSPQKSKESSSSGQSSSDKSIDPIQSWGKPLGLPPPPPEKNRWFPTWDPIEEWGKPLGLPTPAPPLVKKDSAEDVEVDLTPTSNKTTPKKVAKKNIENNKSASYIAGGKEVNTKAKRPESPVKRSSNKENRKSSSFIYLDLSYVPHNGNSHYTNVEFFKRVRARYYVFSGTEPSREVFNALLEAKQTWEDKDLEVTIIPTYDTDVLGYWVAENEELLAKYKIDLSPSASRCTINLQDHETSCSAYRLEF